MDSLRAALDKTRAWVEAHALGVGVSGLVAIAVAVVVAVVALAAGGDEPEPVALTTTTRPTIPPETVPGTAPPATAPTPAPGEAPATVAVKVDNAPEARPQVGLDAAALLLEVPVEGGLTRLTAVFESFDRTVGPVRSLRPVDADLLVPFTDIVVSSGGQPFVLQAVDAAALVRSDGEFAPGWVESEERPRPYNLFVDLTQVAAALQPQPLPRPGLPVGEWPGGERAGSIRIPFTEPAVWEPEGDRYRRVGFEVVPELGGEPAELTVDTVLVLFAAERFAGYRDANGVDVPTFDVVGTGRMLMFHRGEMVEGTWLRGAQEDPYGLFTAEGSSVGVPGGATYVAVVPRELDVEL